MIGALSVGEEPRLTTVDLPDLAEHRECGFCEGQGAFFVAFSDDPQKHRLGVDGGNGQSDGLTESQAAGVDKSETAAVDGLADRGDQTAAVCIVSNVGQTFAIGLADFFLVSSDQS